MAVTWMCLIVFATCRETTAGFFSLLVPEAPISAPQGGSVVLSSVASPSFDPNEVSWYRPGQRDNPVLLYQNQKIQEDAGDPQYRGRAFFTEGLQKGDVSMRLENLTLADRGQYVCYVQSKLWYEEAEVSLTVIGAFSLLVPVGPISAPLGGSVVLYTVVSPSFDPHEVSWYRPGQRDNPVLLYQNQKIQEEAGDPQCRGRTFFTAGLKKGDVSLKLENLTLADRGLYICTVHSTAWYEEANVSLTVRVTGSTPVMSSHATDTGEHVNVSCVSDGWTPEPTVTWRDKNNNEIKQNSNQVHFYDEDGFVGVSSWLLYSSSESEWLSCSVGLSDQDRREGRILLTKNIVIQSGHLINSIAVPFVITLSALLMLIIGIFIIYRKTLIQSAKETTSTPDTGAKETTSLLGTSTTETTSTPDTVATETTSTPGTGATETTSTPDTGATETTSLLGTVATETTSTPGTSATETSSTPDTGATETSSTSDTGATETSSTPDTVAIEITSVLVTGATETTTQLGLIQFAKEIKSTQDTSATETISTQDTGATETTLSTDTGATQTTSLLGTGATEITSTPDTGATEITSTPDTGATETTSTPDTGATEITSTPDTGARETSSSTDTGSTETTSTPGKQPGCADTEWGHLKSYQVKSISLNPSKVHRPLEMLKDGTNTRVKCVHLQLCPEPEEMFPLVHSCESFESGQHFWGVKLWGKNPENPEAKDGYKKSWFVGVCRDSAVTLTFPQTPQNGLWYLQYERESGLAANSDPPTPVPMSKQFRKLGVFLDCDKYTLSFYNVDAHSHLYTFKDMKFNKLFAVISPGVKDREVMEICADVEKDL